MRYIRGKQVTQNGVKLPNEIVDLIRFRRIRRRAWQRLREPFIKQEINLLTRRIDLLPAEVVNNNFSKAVHSISQDLGHHGRKFWRLTKVLRNRPRPIPALKVDNVRLVTDEEKANAFADLAQSRSRPIRPQ